MEDYARILASRLPPPVGSDKEALIGEFKRLQTMRIQTYHHYNAALVELVQENRLGAYTTLCSHYTSIFSDISNAVRDVRDQLATQDAALARLISKIQEIEKTKLGILAKYHMAYMNSRSPLDFSIHVDASVDEYTAKIRRLEELVNEEMDNVQSMLCEDINVDGASIRGTES